MLSCSRRRIGYPNDSFCHISMSVKVREIRSQEQRENKVEHLLATGQELSVKATDQLAFKDDSFGSPLLCSTTCLFSHSTLKVINMWRNTPTAASQRFPSSALASAAALVAGQFLPKDPGVTFGSPLRHLHSIHVAPHCSVDSFCTASLSTGGSGNACI